MISSGSVWVWGSIQLPRCPELGSGMAIAGIELVCGAECISVQTVQLHKPMLFLAGGKVSATSAAALSSGKRGIAKKERKREKKRSVIRSKISSVCLRLPEIQFVCNVCRMSATKDRHRQLYCWAFFTILDIFLCRCNYPSLATFVDLVI